MKFEIHQFLVDFSNGDSRKIRQKPILSNFDLQAKLSVVASQTSKRFLQSALATRLTFEVMVSLASRNPVSAVKIIHNELSTHKLFKLVVWCASYSVVIVGSFFILMMLETLLALKPIVIARCGLLFFLNEVTI